MLSRQSSQHSAPLLAAALFAASCGGGGSSPAAGPQGPTMSLRTIDTSQNQDGIVTLPESVDPRIRAVFDRYTELTAPNGERIHFLAQPGVTDATFFRVRVVLRQHLEDVPGTDLGANKSIVFNRIATKQTTVAVYESDTSFDPTNVEILEFMDLFDGIVAPLDASTTVQEGSPAYLQPDPAIDSTLDVTLQLALRFGIEDGAPQFQMRLSEAALNALANDLYRPSPGLAQDVVDDAYLGLALSVYYGVWAHDPHGDGTAGPGNEYDFSDRDSMRAGDPLMTSLIESFFSPTQSFPAYLDDSFTGTFEMQFDSNLPYTHRSRYLERVGLRSNAGPARINGNELDNTFLGGTSADEFEGRGGNDILEGDTGANVAYYTGNRADYLVAPVDSTVWRVTDTVPGRDGVDDLRQIARLVFADGTLDL